MRLLLLLAVMDGIMELIGDQFREEEKEAQRAEM